MNSIQMVKLASEMQTVVPVLYVVAYASVAVMALGILSTFRKRG